MKGGVIMNNTRGFTLLELIVVIAILGVLGVILAPRFYLYAQSARIARDQATANAWCSAYQVYFTDHKASGLEMMDIKEKEALYDTDNRLLMNEISIEFATIILGVNDENELNGACSVLVGP